MKDFQSPSCCCCCKNHSSWKRIRCSYSFAHMCIHLHSEWRESIYCTSGKKDHLKRQKKKGVKEGIARNVEMGPPYWPSALHSVYCLVGKKTDFLLFRLWIVMRWWWCWPLEFLVRGFYCSGEDQLNTNYQVCVCVFDDSSTEVATHETTPCSLWSSKEQQSQHCASTRRWLWLRLLFVFSLGFGERASHLEMGVFVCICLCVCL